MIHHHRRRHDPLKLTPDLLVAAYAQGVFPMAPSRYAPAVQWFSPDPRAILPLDGFRLTRSLRQKLRRGAFDLRRDTAFEQVIRSCAKPRPHEPESWINDQIIDAFIELHGLNIAHSVEAWAAGQLVGGLYGVALGGAFFGESMFHVPGRGTDASKACLAHLVDHLRERGFELLDVQINSEHMRRFGAIDIPRPQYLKRLERALAIDCRW